MHGAHYSGQIFWKPSKLENHVPTPRWQKAPKPCPQFHLIIVLASICHFNSGTTGRNPLILGKNKK